ncbi:MAG: prenyltransferase/squalene oxidase repeat-containing protein [Flavonifractor plautii]
MKKWKQRGFAFVLALSLTTGMLTGAQAAVSKETLNEAVQDTAEYMYRTVQNPQVGSIGGEWAVLGLARSGYDVPDSYYQDYYATVEAYVTACDGKLHDKKYTEYSRVIVALSSIGKDARNVAGYDLTKPLGDYEKTIWQGLNGPIWALIALDSAGYPMPENPEANVQATRQMYIDRILECQLPDGGWSLFGGTEAASSGDGISDPDITGMALQALAKYQDQPEVARATKEALTCMSEQQSDDGGFASWGTANSESCVQMIVALCELGIELDDPRFVKNGNTMLDNLMTFYRQGRASCTPSPAPGPTRWRRSRASTAWWPPSGRRRGAAASTACPTPSPSPTPWRQR